MRRIFITGGTGFFGKSMLDYRLHHPDWEWAQAEWIILSRSPERFADEYPQLANQAGIAFVGGDVRDFAFPQGPFDAIIHAATSAVTTLSERKAGDAVNLENDIVGKYVEKLLGLQAPGSAPAGSAGSRGLNKSPSSGKAAAGRITRGLLAENGFLM